MKRLILAYLIGVSSVLLPVVAAVRPVPYREKWHAYLMTGPPAFTNLPEWRAVADEGLAVGEVLEAGYTRLADYTGKYVNVRNGFRVVTGQPKHYAYTIWILGSSTTLDLALPDGDTFESQLQAIMPDVRVVNAGMIAASIVTQKNRLMDLPLAAGDMVLFYDGIGDANIADQPDWLESAKKALHEAQTFTESKGARFVQVLEPNSVFGMSSAEAAVLDRLVGNNASRIVLVRAVYESLRQFEPDSADLTHCLDGYRAAGHIVFLDMAHLGDPQAAVLVAKCMEDIISRFNGPALSVNKGTGTPFPPFAFNAGLLNIKGGAS